MSRNTKKINFLEGPVQELLEAGADPSLVMASLVHSAIAAANREEKPGVYLESLAAILKAAAQEKGDRITLKALHDACIYYRDSGHTDVEWVLRGAFVNYVDSSRQSN